MRNFTNVPIFDINCIKCLHTVVVWFRLQRLQCFLILNKFRILNTMVQVMEEMIWMLNELIQANEMVFMNFWYIEHNDAKFWRIF